MAIEAKASFLRQTEKKLSTEVTADTMAKRGMPIQTIAAILGHEKIETTMEYIVMNKDNTKLQYRQYYAC